jgi:hypothetical protein
MIPLSEEALFGLYGAYNQALGLAPNIGYALCVMALLLAFSPRPGSDRAISAILATFWIWTGAVFHIGFFAPLNWGAWIFGALFILEGLLLAWAGVLLGRFDFRLESGPRGWAGFALLAFGLAWPVLDVLTGHLWPRLQLPGTLPAPTVLATLGLLLTVRGRAVWPFAIIPLLWGLVGGAAAYALGIWQDAAMGIAALAGFGLLAFNRPSRP